MSVKPVCPRHRHLESAIACDCRLTYLGCEVSAPAAAQSTTLPLARYWLCTACDRYFVVRRHAGLLAIGAGRYSTAFKARKAGAG